MKNKMRLLALIAAVLMIDLLTLSNVASAATVSVNVNIQKTIAMTFPAKPPLYTKSGDIANTDFVVPEIKANCAWNISLHIEPGFSNVTETIPSKYVYTLIAQ